MQGFDLGGLDCIFFQMAAFKVLLQVTLRGSGGIHRPKEAKQIKDEKKIYSS